MRDRSLVTPWIPAWETALLLQELSIRMSDRDPLQAFPCEMTHLPGNLVDKRGV
jgi:hypothetical protein